MQKILYFLYGVIFSASMTIVTISLFYVDGFVGAAHIFLKVDQTIRATNFSEKEFDMIDIDSDLQYVLEKIGEPLSWSDEQGVRFGHWTAACCSGSASVRILGFKNGKVVSKVAEYDWD